FCSCSSNGFETVDLHEPNPYVSKFYSYEPTINNAIKHATHVAIVELADIEPYGGSSNNSIFTFSVKSVLAGGILPETIKIIRPITFYKSDETYLLFLYGISSTLWPFDLFVPFDLFTFRITDGENIDCLQAIDNVQTNTTRSFVEPFKDAENNKFSVLKPYITARSKSTIKLKYASSNLNLDYLINQSDLIMEIIPTRIAPVENNAFIADVWYEVVNCYKGTPSGNWMMLPNTVEINCNYVVFLDEVEPCSYVLESRGSFFRQGSIEYDEFFSTWKNR
ncbi:MAG: hypothetical protein PHV03_11280, partial [Desulfitobacteriaceae bacterium]|nr:hypothetical protein [Desulfitobacteriaceae bacterium]